jgi:4-carboxymuconolactone decarboxylase
VFDAALVQAADDLHHHARIGNEVWATLSGSYSTEQLLDVVFAVGNYTLVSMALNTCGVVLDASVPRVPLESPE